MYVINEYQLIAVASETYLNHFNLGSLITPSQLMSILNALKTWAKKECQDEQLKDLAYVHELDFNLLKMILEEKLAVIKPTLQKKVPIIHLFCQDELITQLLLETLSLEFEVSVLKDIQDSQDHAFILFYHQDYRDDVFKNVYAKLKPNTYLVSAGVMEQQLIIDNLYIEKSGLPSHFANLQQVLLQFSQQKTMRNPINTPLLKPITSCQRAYIAYCLHQFLQQYLNFWDAPVLLDEINTYWRVDLRSFLLKKEVAFDYSLGEHDFAQQMGSLNTEEII